MVTYNGRKGRFRFIYVIAIFPIVFILIAALLMLSLLTSDNCNCPHEDHVLAKKPTVPPERPPGRPGASPHRLAVLVPFRDRFEELLVFAPYLKAFLDEQHVDHDIFVLNQVDRYRFNRASLINVGYLFTKDTHDYVAMHDVDLLPLNHNLSYEYPKRQPFHVASPKFHPKYHYDKFVGGILLVNREHFRLVNGMSNKYWGWGLEDDEFYVRLVEAKLNVTRPENISTGTSDTFKHIHDRNHRKRDTAKCYNQRNETRRRDRRTGLHDVNYKIQDVHSLNIDGAEVTVINIQLFCDHNLTPWCDCSDVLAKKNK